MEPAEPGRPRVNSEQPEKSLLLLKSTFAVSHGGGQRLEPESADYHTLRDWIRQGAPMKSTLYSACTGIHFRRRKVLRLGALSFLGISLDRYLALQGALGATARRTGKAESCILIWLNGGPSQIDTWDPKPNSSFKPIATSVDGIQISELLPRTARQMDKLAVIRSMHTEENNHLQGLHYAITGHRPNPVMKYPSFGSIVGRELGSRNDVPSYVKFKLGDARYADIFKAHFIGAEYDPMVLPDPRGDFTVPDLTLPESASVARIEDRRSFLKLVDGLYRNRVQSQERSTPSNSRRRT